MATPDIQILVGVKGGGSISGASGKLIQSQIASIMGSIAKSGAAKLHIKDVLIDPAATTALQAKVNAANIQLSIDTITASQQAIDNLKTSISGAMVSQTLDSITIDPQCLQKMADDIKRKIETMPEVEVPWKWKQNTNNPPGPNPKNPQKGKKSQQELDLERIIKLEKQWTSLETKRVNTTNRRGNQAEAAAAEKASIDAGNALKDAKDAYLKNYGISQADLDDEIAKSEQLLALRNKLANVEGAALDRKDKLLQNEALSWDKVTDRVLDYWTVNKDVLAQSPDIFNRVKQLSDALLSDDPTNAVAQIVDFNGGNLSNDPKSILNYLYQIQQQAIKTGSATETMGQKITRVFKEKFGYGVMAAAAASARKAISQLYTNVVELEDAMAQMKIVTGASTKALKEYSEGAADAAKATGRTMTEIMASSTEYARLGYNLEESLKLSETTAKLSNVADIDTAEATSAMTAILKGFRLEARDAEMVGDMMTEVANKYAIDAGELGAALERGGASLAAANNTLAESMALMAAGNAAIQNAETVGTAFKTSSMRIRGTSVEELEEAGLATDGLIESTAKLQRQIKALSGVDIMIDSETYKSTYQIMLEIAKVWDNISDINQAALLEALAGKRNSQVLMSVIQNLDDLTGSYEAAQNAAGAMEEANAIAMDTITGKTKALSASWQELSGNLLNSELVKGFMDLAMLVVNGFNDINQATGGVIVQITALVALFAVLKVAIGTMQASALAGGFGALKKSITGITSALASFFGQWKTAGIRNAASGMLSLATPATKATLAITALVAVGYGAYKIYKKFNPTLEELATKAKEANGEVEELSSAISENNKRIYELQELSRTGKITSIEAEELEQLKEENHLLGLQLQLKQDLADIATKEAADKAHAEVAEFFSGGGTATHTSREDGSEYTFHFRSGADLFTEDLEEYKRLKVEYEQALRDGDEDAADDLAKRMSKASGAIQATMEQMETWTSNLDLNNPEDLAFFERLQEQADKARLLMGGSGVVKSLFDDIIARDKWSDAVTALQEVGKEGELTVGKLSALRETNPLIDEFVQYLVRIGMIDPNNFANFVNQFNRLQASLTGSAKETPIATMVESVKGPLDTLRSGMEEMAETGVISLETLKDVSSNSDLKKYLVQTANGYKLTTGAVEDFTNAQLKQYDTALTEAKQAAAAIINQQANIKMSVDDTTDAYVTQIETMIAAESAALVLAQSSAASVLRASGAGDSAFYAGGNFDVLSPSAIEAKKNLSELRAILNDLKVAQTDRDNIESVLSTPSKHSSSSEDDPYKDKVDLRLRKLKHQLEMNEITSEQYYNELENILNVYYKDSVEHQKKYAEEIMDLEEELFNGRRELLDDWVNDQQKAAERLIKNGQAVSASNAGIAESYKELAEELDGWADKWNALNNGNVDYHSRKVLNASDLIRAGWNSTKDLQNLEGADGVTTYSQGYYGRDFTDSNKKFSDAYVEVTPILSNGKILSPEALDAYMERIFKSSNILKADKVENGGKGLIMNFWEDPTNEEITGYFGALEEIKNAHLDTWKQMQSVSTQRSESALDYYYGIITKVQSEVDKAYAYGLDENSDYIQELETRIQDAAQNILDITKSVFDDFISYADDFNRWDNIGEDLDISKIEMLRAKMKSIQKLLDDGTISWEEYAEAYQEAAKNLYDTQKESIETIIDLTMEMIEQEKEDEIEALEDQLDTYEKLIEAKKELLEETKDEADHEKAVAELVEEIAELQSNISKLSMDDSREAAAKKLELEKELHEKNKELADLQNNYTLDKTIETLDKSVEAKEDATEAETEAIEESIDTWVKKYQLAIKRIDKDWDNLYDDLLDYQEEYRDSIDGVDSFKTAWLNVEDTIADVNANISSTITSTIKGIEDLYQVIEHVGLNPGMPDLDENGEWTGTISGSGNSSNPSGNYSQYTSMDGYSIIEEMYNNSVAAKKDPTQRNALNQRNRDLAADFYMATNQMLTYNPASGSWHLGSNASGELLYKAYGLTPDGSVGTTPIHRLKKYHTGGIVDGTGAINDEEVFAILKRGELIFNDEQKSQLKKLLRGMFSVINTITGFSTNAMRMPNTISPAVAGGNFAPSFEINISHNGSMSDKDARRYGDLIGDAALEKLRVAFNKRGVR